MVEWSCPLCLDYSVLEVKDLAYHVQRSHDEWLEGNRIPPIVTCLGKRLI